MCHKIQIRSSAVQVNKALLHSPLLFFCVVWTVLWCTVMYHTYSIPTHSDTKTNSYALWNNDREVTEDVLDKTCMFEQCCAPNLFRQLLNVWLSPAAPWKRYSECGFYKLAPLRYQHFLISVKLPYNSDSLHSLQEMLFFSSFYASIIQRRTVELYWQK